MRNAAADYDSDYNPLVGAYILECSPGNDDLCFLIEYVDEIQDAAIDMLLKRSPNEKEKALIAKYRS